MVLDKLPVPGRPTNLRDERRQTDMGQHNASCQVSNTETMQNLCTI